MIKLFLQHLCLLGMLLSYHSLLYADIYDPSASVFRFQKKMAERGDVASQFKLGLMYETGSGVDTNLESALLWYNRAAEHEYKPARNRLTYLEIKQSGFREKHKQWLKNLKNDARFNEGEALFLLGQMYAEGTGVNKSLTRSIKLLRKASAANIPGSESEILRVESELVELQKQYLTEKDKKAVTPISAIPIKTPTPKVTGKTTRNNKTSRKQSSNKNRNASLKTIKQPVKKTLARSTKPGIKATTKTSQPSKMAPRPSSSKQTAQHRKSPQQIPEDTHPMDTICSGRNLFSSGCR